MQRLRHIAPGVLVAHAEQYSTTTTVVTGHGGGCLLIDPAVSVADLAGIAADLAAAGLTPRAGFATHPHWDHVLWSAALGDAPRYASAAAVATAHRERTGLVSGVQEAAPGHDLGLFARLEALPAGRDGAPGSIPWDGPAASVTVHDGHAPGHAAVFVEAAGVLVAGDMLSDIEIPILDTDAADPLGDYLTGLRRLAAVDGVRWLVPGHGSVGDAAEFRRRVEADLCYLERLAAGERFDDPRCSAAWLREVHERQLAAARR